MSSWIRVWSKLIRLRQRVIKCNLCRFFFASSGTQLSIALPSDTFVSAWHVFLNILAGPFRCSGNSIACNESILIDKIPAFQLNILFHCLTSTTTIVVNASSKHPNNLFILSLNFAILCFDNCISTTCTHFFLYKISMTINMKRSN